MKFAVVTLFPEMFSAVTDFGISKRAIENNLAAVSFFNPRDYSHNKHKHVDDRPFGGGPGMVMSPQPLSESIQAAKQVHKNAKVIELTPQGQRLDQQMVARLSSQPEVILVAGRYEGIDERVVKMEVDEQLSIGDYVVSGGELAAMILIDAIIRLIPDALGNENSAKQDSFVDGLLDCPHYTRPELFKDVPVPEVLLSGDHKAIEQWRLKQSLGRTWKRRPDLIAKKNLDKREQALLQEYLHEE